MRAEKFSPTDKDESVMVRGFADIYKLTVRGFVAHYYTQSKGVIMDK